MDKIWANSGDSHFLEPEDLWRTRPATRPFSIRPQPVRRPST